MRGNDFECFASTGVNTPPRPRRRTTRNLRLHWSLLRRCRRAVGESPRGQNHMSFAIRDECANTVTDPDPRISNGSSILTRPSAGR
jgi:hypothetical protein